MALSKQERARMRADGMTDEQINEGAAHEEEVERVMEFFRAIVDPLLPPAEAASMITDLAARLLVERCGPRMAMDAYQTIMKGLVAIHALSAIAKEKKL